MKKEVSPAVVITIIALVVVIAGWFLYKQYTGYTEEPSANLNPKGMGASPGRGGGPPPSVPGTPSGR